MNIRILLIDDNPDFLEQTKLSWENEGEDVDVDTTTSPSEALDKIDENDYDCVVADYQMPEMDGLELLKEVRKAHEDMIYGLLTGKGDEDVAIDAIDLKADIYIKKGTKPESQFEKIMDNIFDKSIS